MAEKIHNRIGGVSVKEEFITGAAMKIISMVFHSIEHKEVAQKILRELSPTVEMLMDPIALNTGLAMLPDFGYPEVAQGVKHALVHIAGEITDMSHDAKYAAGMNEAGYAEAFNRAATKANAKMFAALGRFFHERDCTELPVPRGQVKPKKGEAQPPQQGYRELGLARAVQMKLLPCPICITGAKEMKLPSEPEPAKKPRGLEIIANCKDADAKKAFDALFSASGPEDKRRIIMAVDQFLSSEGEYLFMTRVIPTYQPEEYPAYVAKLEDLLRLDEGKRSETQNLFGSLGSILQGGGTLALGVMREVWDATSESGAKPETQADEPSGQPRRWLFGLIPLPRKKPKKRKRIGIIKAFTL